MTRGNAHEEADALLASSASGGDSSDRGRSETLESLEEGQRRSTELNGNGTCHPSSSVSTRRVVPQRASGMEIECSNGDFPASNGSVGIGDDNGDDDPPSRSSSPPPPPVVIFGFDLSGLSDTTQFVVCAGGLFLFTVGYGYLQELVLVELMDRKLSVFVSAVQFAGYSFWSYVLSKLRFSETYEKGEASSSSSSSSNSNGGGVFGSFRWGGGGGGGGGGKGNNNAASASAASGGRKPSKSVPFNALVGCSLLKAADLGLTNAAMRYINYPAKTLIKSSRIFFTMITGILVNQKRYRIADYAVVGFLVSGLAIFLRAESTSSAVFHPLGVAMLCASLLLDGAVINWSEHAMNKYGMCHDDFNCRLYTISLAATAAAAHANGELTEGCRFLLTPGIVGQIVDDPNVPSPTTWTVPRKLSSMALFSTLGVFGASCGGAITKRFGAFATSVTSTVRKATTLFLSFLMFQNECTAGHVQGMSIFFAALFVKSVRASRKRSKRGGGGGKGGGKGGRGGGSGGEKEEHRRAEERTERADDWPSSSFPALREESAAGKADRMRLQDHPGRHRLRNLSAVSLTELMGGDLGMDSDEDSN